MSFPVSIVPTSSVFISLQTSATGTSYVSFASHACDIVNIANTDDAATTIEVQKNGTGPVIKIPAGAAYYFAGITNANQLAFKRVDNSNTQFLVCAEAMIK